MQFLNINSGSRHQRPGFSQSIRIKNDGFVVHQALEMLSLQTPLIFIRRAREVGKLCRQGLPGHQTVHRELLNIEQFLKRSARCWCMQREEQGSWSILYLALEGIACVVYNLSCYVA